MKKKILAIFLSLCMAMSLLPVTALATENGTAVTTDTTELKSGSYYVSNNIKLNHSLTISAGATVTLDLRGQTLTLQQLFVNGSLTIYDSQNNGEIKSTITDQNKGAIEVGTAGLLTLESGTISSPGYGVYVFDGGKTIVNDGMITSFYAPLAGNNTAGDMNFEVNGGTLTASRGPAIYMPGQVSLKITGGTLNGGISLRMGQVDISGGTINAITEYIDPITGFYDYSGNAWLADALYVFNGTYTSGNTSYENSLNLNITGGTFNCTNKEGSAVAIYDLGKVAQNSQVNISGDAVLNSSVDGRGAYQVLSLADVGVIEPAAGYGKEEYVGKVSTTITGGTFSSKPDADYIATGYAATKNDAGKYVVGLKDDGALEVKPSTDSGKTSATLEGIYAGEGTVVEKPENGTGSGTPNKAGTDVTVDLTTKGEEPAETTGTVELTVNADTAQSLVSANAEALTVKSDVGTVSLDKDALGELKDVSEPVVISIAATNDEGAAPTWEVTVKEGEKELFAETTDVGITITVPAPAGATAENTKVYCIDNGMEDMSATYNDSNKTLKWTTKHLSTFAAVTLGEDDVATWTTKDGKTSSGSLADALNAVATNGGTITLLQNATLDNANYTISEPVTIQGAGTIDATVADGASTIGFSIKKDASLTLNGVTMNVKGTKAESAEAGNDGTAIELQNGGSLLVKNGASLNLTNLNRGMIMTGTPAPVKTAVSVEDATLTAKGIDGNFSNGGQFTFTNATVKIEDCGDHALSANTVTVNNSTLEITRAGKRGISINDSDGALTLKNNASVSVENCGTDYTADADKEKYAVVIGSATTSGKVSLDATSTLSVSGCTNGDVLDLAGQSTLENNGVVHATVNVPAGSNQYIVTYKNQGQQINVVTVTATSGKAPVKLPAALSDYGYNHFVGWSDGTNTYKGGETVTITGNTTFTAVWSYIPPANPNYRIDIPDFEGGTVTADPAAAKAGATVTLTATPDEGYAVGTITVTDRFGDAVKVTENADGTYTFTMPNGQVTVKATFVETEEPAPAMPFTDVHEGDWFYEEVLYAYENGLMNGVGDNRFAPNSETTRAQLVTILYRLEGEPAVSGDLPFTDVEAGIWYTDAILWAAQNNIVNGVNDTEFAPGDDLTRQQLVTILYRYAEAKGYDVSASADLSGYPDAGQVQDYAQPAMAWAVAENIIQGMEDGTLKPAGNASRAQIATILMRFCEDVAQ